MQEHCSPELIAEIVDAFNQKDFDAVANFFAKDGVFRTARRPVPGTLSIVGPDAIKEYLAAWHAQFRDWQWV
jgi:ketosteroid isomerase-like protein